MSSVRYLSASACMAARFMFAFITAVAASLVALRSFCRSAAMSVSTEDTGAAGVVAAAAAPVVVAALAAGGGVTAAVVVAVVVEGAGAGGG
jgi:hypothetical protein